MTRSETYKWLLEECRYRVEELIAFKKKGTELFGWTNTPHVDKDIERWQAAVDLLESECPFHLEMLGG